MIYVIAGNYQQARNWIQEQIYLTNECRPVRGSQDLRGLSPDSEFVLTGTWWERKDINEIHQIVQIILSMREKKETPSNGS